MPRLRASDIPEPAPPAEPNKYFGTDFFAEPTDKRSLEELGTAADKVYKRANDTWREMSESERSQIMRVIMRLMKRILRFT